MDKPAATFKDAGLSAVILALANMGDAFLYAYLPAHHQQIGISAFWVGVILSVNRVTRFFLNGWVAWIASRRGIKAVVAAAILAASFTTASYGSMSVVPLWILARVLWGVSFSTLRLGNTLYALEHPRKGAALGLSRGLIELGPVLALMTGPLLLQYAGSASAFVVFGLIGLAGILLVLPLSDLKTEIVTKKDLVLSFPSSFNVLVLINAFTTEGVLVVLSGRLLSDDHTADPAAALALTGVLLGYRRLSFVLFSPLAGWLADRRGFEKIFMYTTLLSAASLLCVLFGAPVAGIISVFTFASMNSSVATGGAIQSGRASIIKEASDNAAWRDIGMAAGAFAGALMLSVTDLRLPIIALVVFYAIGLFYHGARSERKE